MFERIAVQGALALALILPSLQLAAYSPTKAEIKEYLEMLQSKDDETRASGANMLATARPPIPSAAAALTQALDDPYRKVRVSAMLGLGSIGKGAKMALPKLNELLTAASPQDHDFIESVINDIGPPQEVRPAQTGAAAAKPGKPAKGQQGVLNQALADFKAKRFDAAVAGCDKVLKLEKGSIPALTLKVCALYSGGKRDLADAGFIQIYDLKPSEAGPYVMFATLAESQGDWKRAAQWLLAAKEQDKENVNLLSELAAAYLKAGDVINALFAMDDAVKHGAPKFDCDLVESMVSGVAQSGDMTRLDDASSSGRRLCPDRAVLWYYRGVYYASHNYNDDAVTNFEQAVKLDPGNAHYQACYDKAKAASDANTQAIIDDARASSWAMKQDLAGGATKILQGVNAASSGSSSSSSYDGGGSYVAPSSGSSHSSSAGSSGGIDYNKMVNDRVTQKLWDMNNPHK